jgi:DNA invertase Pin-like site-specific DNA recombinase
MKSSKAAIISSGAMENYIESRKKLLVEQNKEIRRLHALGLSHNFIAKDLGCSRTTIWRILKADGRRNSSN